MTAEPMTNERLAAIRARCRADVTSRWRGDVRELLAEIDRLRAINDVQRELLDVYGQGARDLMCPDQTETVHDKETARVDT